MKCKRLTRGFASVTDLWYHKCWRECECTSHLHIHASARRDKLRDVACAGCIHFDLWADFVHALERHATLVCSAARTLQCCEVSVHIAELGICPFAICKVDSSPVHMYSHNVLKQDKHDKLRFASRTSFPDAYPPHIRARTKLQSV